jgi:hypothetical protein
VATEIADLRDTPSLPPSRAELATGSAFPITIWWNRSNLSRASLSVSP